MNNFYLSLRSTYSTRSCLLTMTRSHSLLSLFLCCYSFSRTDKLIDECIQASRLWWSFRQRPPSSVRQLAKKKEIFFFERWRGGQVGLRLYNHRKMNDLIDLITIWWGQSKRTRRKKRIPSSRRVYSVLIMMFTHTIDKTKMPNKQWIDSFERFSSSLLRLISIGENEQMTTSILQINQECRARMRASQRSMIFPSLTHSRKLIKSSLLFERKSK